jgi:CHAD domain-containing protein
MNTGPITADLPIVEAGRRLMAGELAIMRDQLPELRRSADATAVHETRKAIRRSFTLFKLFTPYFAEGVLLPYRKGLRRIMRRLGPCRDLAVFRLKLETYNETSGQPLSFLAAYWAEQQAMLDSRLQAFLKEPELRKFLAQYSQFTETEGAGLPENDGQRIPLQVRHALPTLVYQRLGAVRAYGDILDTATPAQFHQLRIQFKELRYTLTFFEELLGPVVSKVIDFTRLAQDDLGHLNDADVALRLLDGCACCPEEVALYRAHQEAEIARLVTNFPPLYERFNRPKMRKRLALALARL